MRYKGTLSEWNDDRGFGFITHAKDSDRVFVHVSSFLSKGRRPALNDKLSFEVGPGKNGKAQALNVKNESVKLSGLLLDFQTLSSFGFVSLFFVIIDLASVRGLLESWVLYVYIGTSLATVLFYAIDKHKARQEQWRINENTLHALEIFGGWPGALLAQRVFKHKSRKSSYQVVFWLCVLINIAGLIWLHS